MKKAIAGLMVVFSVFCFPANVLAFSPEAGQPKLIEPIFEKRTAHKNILSNGEAETLMGWKDIDGDLYYYIDGAPLKGRKIILGKSYFFSYEDGRLLYGWIYDEQAEAWYFADSDGVLVNGWQEIDGNLYYFYNTFNTRSRREIDGKMYYFNPENGKLCHGWIKATDWDGAIYFAGNDGVLVTGWQNIDDARYYFENSYAMVTGPYNIGGSKYLFERSSGKMQIGKAFDHFGPGETDGFWYYCQPDGRILTGWQTIGGQRYYYYDNGELVTGRYTIYNAYERNYEHYFFNKQNGQLQYGWIKDSGVWYYGGKDGRFLVGWQYIGDSWYYLDKSNGAMVTGDVAIDGKTHSFNSSGVWLGEKSSVSNDRDGIQEGWKKESGSWYYYINGAKQTGWLQVGTRWYYLDKSSGAMQTGWLRDGTRWYYLDKSSGIMQTGWLQEGSNKYYLDKKSGIMATGEVTIDGKVHQFDNGGKWQGEITGGGQQGNFTGWRQYGNSWYYYIRGAAQKGWVQVGKDWYYMDASAKMTTGWQQVGSAWYYLRDNGKMMYSSWLQEGKSWYYLRDNGKMATGKMKIGSTSHSFTAGGRWLGKVA